MPFTGGRREQLLNDIGRHDPRSRTRRQAGVARPSEGGTPLCV
jgi:hypothetical protein